MKIHYFQRYHEKENVATANTMLLLSRLYQYWGCANRIVNGRAVCDSHHINEDALYATYHAAIEAMIEDAGAILNEIKMETAA